MRRLCVFAGSSPGRRPEYVATARTLAKDCAGRGIGLVFGGGSVGMMGALADAALEAGAEVIGVIPRALASKELAHTGVTELYTVENMHERKAKMTDLADAFLALPGGFGTLDELFEAWSWNALGYHKKPFCLLNVEGYWDGMIEFIDHATESGFLSGQRRSQLLVASTPEEALDLLDEAAAAATQGMVW